MSKYLIDMQTKQLTMLDARFYWTEDGQFVPSVTTILEAYPKDAQFFKWLKEVGTDADNIRDDAGRRGSVVHTLTERYDNGEEISLLNDMGGIGYKMIEWSMFERYVDFIARYQPEIIMTEQNIVSTNLGFAGTLDRVMKIDGKTYLVDIKTSNMVHESYWLQLAAYEALLSLEMDVHVDAVAILHLNAKTRTNGSGKAMQGIGWQMLTMPADGPEIENKIDLFRATRELWQAQNKDAKPRKISYTLTHKK